MTFLRRAAAGHALALAQAPAAPEPAKAKPPQPGMCAACHTLEGNQIGGYYESAAFKSQSMQIDVGGKSPQILRFDPKTLKVVDDGKDKTPSFLREAKKRHEVIVTWAVVNGVKTATRSTSRARSRSTRRT
jgi:hypothetical protein